MSSLLIKNIGTLVTGDMQVPIKHADSIYVEDGVVKAISKGLEQKADQVIHAQGITAIPGLVDSQSHPSIKEYPLSPTRFRPGLRGRSQRNRLQLVPGVIQTTRVESRVWSA